MHAYIPPNGYCVVDGQFNSSVRSRHSCTPIQKQKEHLIYDHLVISFNFYFEIIFYGQMKQMDVLEFLWV